MKNLNECLQYKNDKIVKRFSKIYKISFNESESIFVETKRWLWTCADYTLNHKNTEVIEFSIIDQIVFIDEMWHNFILFTSEYEAFCNEYFGFYLHHVPDTGSEKINILEEKNKIRNYLIYLYDNIGENYFRLWFKNYSKKYSYKKLKKLKFI